MNRASRLLLLGLAALAPALSSAQESLDLPEPSTDTFSVSRVGLHLGSHHWPDRRKSGRPWNNVNPGAYVLFNNGATLGAYHNSYGDATFYAGKTFTSAACAPALTVGLMTGYPGGVRPMFTPSVCFMGHLRLMAMGWPGKLLVVSAAVEF